MSLLYRFVLLAGLFIFFGTQCEDTADMYFFLFFDHTHFLTINIGDHKKKRIKMPMVFSFLGL